MICFYSASIDFLPVLPLPLLFIYYLFIYFFFFVVFAAFGVINLIDSYAEFQARPIDQEPLHW